jgi:hypothetical protein
MAPENKEMTGRSGILMGSVKGTLQTEFELATLDGGEQVGESQFHHVSFRQAWLTTIRQVQQTLVKHAIDRDGQPGIF